MAKVRVFLMVPILTSVGLGLGCGQESPDAQPSGSGGRTESDSSWSSSVSGSTGRTESGGVTVGGQPASSSEVGGRSSDTGGTTTISSNPGGGSGGSSGSSARGGSSSSAAGTTSSPGGSVSSGGTSAGGGSTSSTASRPDAGTNPPKDAGVPAGDAAVIPPPPVRQDAGASFWAAAFANKCTPPAIGGRAQTDGHHKPGANCMTSGCHLNPKKAEHHAGTDCRGSGCHNNGSPDGSGAPAFLFGGTAYHAATLVPEVGAEIGVKAGTSSYTACSASNGNFWVMAPSGTTSLNWTGASARLRNANGEAPMMTAPAAGCNATSCHTGTLKMTAP